MWYACSIALNSYFENSPVVGPVDLASGVRIEPVPGWVKTDEALKLLSWREREHVKGATLTLATDYEADALGSSDPVWTGKAPRSIQAAIDEKFSLSSVALWLTCPSTLTCGPILHFGRKGDPESLRTAGSLRPVLIREEENDNVPSLEDLAEAGRLLSSMLALERNGSTWIAIRMLVRSLTESMWEARYLWHWVVLESLFGPESPNETTYRLSERVALFLGDQPESRRQLFDEAKKAYVWRSKIVHGGRLGKLTPEMSENVTTFTETLLRDSLVKVLSSPELVRQFNGKGRDRYLDSLVFGN